MKKTIMLLTACLIAVVSLWMRVRSGTATTANHVAVDAQGQLNHRTTATALPRVDRRRAAVTSSQHLFREHSSEEVGDRETEEMEDEPLITLERSATDQYLSELDVSFRLRMRLLRLFDQFVETADLTEDEAAAFMVAVYDAQSEFAEIERRPYVYVNRRTPKPPDWVAEASDDAEMLRREFLRDVSEIVGTDRAILLDPTFVTTLEILPFRVFLKPGYAPIALIAEQPF